VKIKLLKRHGNYPAGKVWDCPWASLAARLVRDGAALAVDRADRHLNPKPKKAAPTPSEG
jgi:hypothetical protein